jgi:hypothetical protein
LSSLLHGSIHWRRELCSISALNERACPDV